MFKAILVHLTGSDCDEGVLTTAKAAAQPFAAHLDCLHVRPSLDALVAASVGTGSDDDALVVSERLDALRKRTREGTRRAHKTFSEFCKRENIPLVAAPPGPGQMTAAWHEKQGGTSALLIKEVRYRDLAVVAGGDMSGAELSSHDLGNLILGAGRPVLLAAAKPSATPIRTVAVAWKDTPEAARAITAALPFLSIAERIVLLSANEENEKAGECVECSDSVMGHLRWHGFRAESRYVIPAGRSIPDAVLETARETGADLLVAGAYGRSRLSESIFGGFTQRVLLGTELPVFLFH